MYAIDNYFEAIPKNKAAQKAHDKQQAKFDRLVARGKTPDWKKAIVKLDPGQTIELN